MKIAVCIGLDSETHRFLHAGPVNPEHLDSFPNLRKFIAEQFLIEVAGTGPTEQEYSHALGMAFYRGWVRNKWWEVAR